MSSCGVRCTALHCITLQVDLHELESVMFSSWLNGWLVTTARLSKRGFGGVDKDVLMQPGSGWVLVYEPRFAWLHLMLSVDLRRAR